LKKNNLHCSSTSHWDTTQVSFFIFQADIDNSGTIDYGEFLAATLHMNKLEREESLVSAFSFFDKDGSGFITIDELSQACNQFGLSDVHLEDMIKDVDQNNVGFLILLFSYSVVCYQN
jgi:Ca2+-binding EF-hand superfamily protein